MRRTKHHIITYVPAEEPTPYLNQICELAEHWSNEIIVAYKREGWTERAGGILPDGVATYGIHASAWSRQEAYSFVGRKAGVRTTRPVTIVGLQPTWLPSNPHVIREAIEYNSGKVLYASRYFMVDARGYRSDGIFAPIKVAPVWPYEPSAHFTNETDTAPAHAWTRPNRGEAPFEILDMAMYGDEEFAVAGTIRMFEGTIAV